jgi:hydroxymethylpyrimidine pyrophosphatase-like HAD family hydrolase
MMKNVKMICFDMDGTIADLYAVRGWEPKLRAEDPTPYIEAKPLWNMEELKVVLVELQKKNIEIRIITWLAIDSSQVYKNEVREAKLDWLAEMGFPFDRFHGVQYGTTKADCVRRYLEDDETAILIDDNAKVRSGWHLGDTVDPTAVDIIEYLRSLI